jgi:hypothetical protein
LHTQGHAGDEGVDGKHDGQEQGNQSFRAKCMGIKQPRKMVAVTVRMRAVVAVIAVVVQPAVNLNKRRRVGQPYVRGRCLLQ